MYHKKKGTREKDQIKSEKKRISRLFSDGNNTLKTKKQLKINSFFLIEQFYLKEIS